MNSKTNSRRPGWQKDITPAILQGYAPPHSEDLEKAVLGAILSERSAQQIAIGVIKNIEFFYKEPHRLIYAAVQELYAGGEPVDLVTVVEYLRKHGTLDRAGGAYGVASLTSFTATANHLENHLHILLEYYTRRRVLTLSQQLLQASVQDETDAFDLLEALARSSSDIMNDLITRKPRTMADVYAEAIRRVQEGIGKQGLTGVPSGLRVLDRVTGGWQPADLIIIAARPAMGKTACALQFAKSAALKFGRKGAIFSLEMSSQQLVLRLIASESEVSGNELTRAAMTIEELEQVVKQSQVLMSNGVFMDDTPGLNTIEFRTKAMKLKADYGIEWIIVDYLQLMTGEKSGTRENEISSISRTLKIVAKELEIPVIALAQLSRAVESRGGDKRPVLSDLRESGAIEQDADCVIFLYRPEYYGIIEDEMGNPTAGTIDFIIAKHRNGPVGTVTAGCTLSQSKVFDLDEAVLSAWSNPNVTSGTFSQLPPSDFNEEPVG